MGVVQKGDMDSSIKVRFEEDNDISSSSSGSHSSEKSDPNGGQETTTPPTAQRLLVSDELGSSNYKCVDANYVDVVVDIRNADEEEIDHDATVQPSTEGDRPDIGTPTQESMENRSSDPSKNEDGVEPEPISRPPKSEEKLEHLIPRNSSKKEKGCIPQNVELYLAVLENDWKTAKLIFDNDSSAFTKKIASRENTAFHIAAAAKNISFVEKMVQLSSLSDLATKNKHGSTALAYAATSGVVRIAEAMVDKNPDLPNIHDNVKRTPVFMAIVYKQKDMASYLLSKTNFEALHTNQQCRLLIAAIDSDYYDIALDILIKKPELAKERTEETGNTALHMLARKPFAIGSSNKLCLWKRLINSRFNGIYKDAKMQTLAHQVVELIWNFVVKELSTCKLNEFIETPSRLVHDAAKVGNAEFLLILIRSYPDLVWAVDNKNKSIFHVAVENRQENVFSLIHELGGLKVLITNLYDENNCFNILHLAGMVASPYHLSTVSGATLQMQRELLWFKEVEKIVTPAHHEMRYHPPSNLSTVKNGRDHVHDDGLTPRELFTKQHKLLLKDGEEWMKSTANSCMLVATLIATVVFAAAFTVPGGNNDKDGTPIFLNNQAFTTFIISDVAALVMSTTSILTFLSILTSRYAEEDFMLSLPIKLLFGLVTLFVSIACMVVAFSASFFIAYHKPKAKIPFIVAATTILPIVCFCVFHFKLVVDILQSCFWPHFSLRKWKKVCRKRVM